MVTISYCVNDEIIPGWFNIIITSKYTTSMTVDLFFAKLLLLYLSFTFLFETYAAFPSPIPPVLVNAINRLLWNKLFGLLIYGLILKILKI